MGGLMSTAGGIVFGGERESLYALDSATRARSFGISTRAARCSGGPGDHQLGGKREFIWG